MLQKYHLKNCLKEYNNPKKTLDDGFYLGYMEACLVQFGVINSKNNGFLPYAIKTKRKFLFWEWETVEDRTSIIVRLVKEYLDKQ